MIATQATTLEEVQDVDDRINLADKFALLRRPYEPGIVGYLNDYKLQIVKVKGPFVWHKHGETDDFFLVVRGRADPAPARSRRGAAGRRAVRGAARR